MKRRYRYLLGPILALSLLMGGCIRPRSVERFGYVLAIGLDEGIQLPYRVTLMLQKAPSGAGEAKGGGFSLAGAECGNLYEAVETLTANLPFLLDFSRTVMVVISDSLLGSGNTTFRGLMEGDYGDLRMRSGIHVMIALGEAKKALEGLESEFDLNVARIQQKLSSYSRESGLIPVTSVAQLKEALLGKTFDGALPLMGVSQKEDTRGVADSTGEHRYAYMGGRMLVEGGMDAGIMGTALLSGQQLCGILDGRNTQLLLMGAGKFSSGRMTLDLGGGQEAVVLLERRRGISRKLDLKTGQVQVTIPLRARLEWSASELTLSKEELEERIAAVLVRELEELFATLQALNCDAMGFGKLAVQSFSDLSGWEAYDWKGAYQKLRGTFSPSVVLEG
ncbi:MAG: hypothetical protein IJF41_02495 [Clostridia bacterium]|nr:hypothetical protein [Clostridia bacterium]